MKLNILGCHSATPTENTHTTSQVLEIKDHLFLIDCGEGTQNQLGTRKLSFQELSIYLYPTCMEITFMAWLV